MKVGIIYKITHPKLSKDCCYIGHTTETIEKRLKGHKQEAKKTKLSNTDGDGKLHKALVFLESKDLVVEEIDSAKSLEELLKLETKYIKKYDSVKKGLNKVKGSRYLTHRKERVSVVVEGKEEKATSKNQLCKKLNIKFTTVNSWQSQGATLQEAVEQALRASKETLSKVGSIKAFRKAYNSYNELAKSVNANKHGWTGKELSKKHKKGSEKELEEILRTPKKFSTKKIQFILPNGKKVKEYNSRKLALDDWENLAKDFGLPTSKKKPARSTVDKLITEGQKPEQAFGLSNRPWKEELIKRGIYKLIDDKGYKLTGVLSGVGIPVVDHEKEEIFSTEKEFAKAYNYDYTTITEEIKKGLTAEEIRKKRGD